MGKLPRSKMKTSRKTCEPMEICWFALPDVEQMTKKSMKTEHSLLATALLALTLSACDSDSNSNGVIDNAIADAGGSTSVSDDLLAGNTTGDTATGGDTGGAATGGDTTGTASGGDTSGTPIDDDTTGGTATGGDTGGIATGDDTAGTASGGDTSGTPIDDDTTGGTATSGDTGGIATGGDTAGTASGGDTSGTPIDDDTTGGTATSGDTSGTDTEGDTGGTTTSDQAELPPANPPTLDPFAEQIASPLLADPFGFDLETDPEVAIAGGPPTQPKNLRLDLVSNNWAEFNWAPSNDDGEVVQYNIYRSDGVVYEVRRDQTDISSGTQNEIDKIWQTTSFIDCNFTRFSDRVHMCNENTPQPGNTYQYEITAVDDDGQESPASDPLSITYLAETNAPVPLYRDIYKGEEDRFASENDLSAVGHWIEEFDLVFGDEFNGDAIDPEKWQTGLTWGDSRIINGEQQYFVNTQTDPDFGYDPFTFTGESMVINAVPIPVDLRENLPPVCDEEDPTGLDRCEFLSGALSTHDRFQYIYGYTEGRFKVSGAPGALSSFYLYHRYAGNDKLHHAPEIDIVEYLGENPFGDPDAFQTYHFGDPNTQITRSAPTMSHQKPDGGFYADNNEWHTFGVLWEPQLVIWYINGIEVKRIFGPQVSRQPMNIINYLVAGSAWAPTPDTSDESLYPIQFEADYIRVYQREAFQGTATFGQP